MCKLFAVTGKLKRRVAQGAIEAVNRKYAFGQRDGFGFVAFGRTGEANAIARGRYTNPDSYVGWKAHGILPAFLRGPAPEEEGEFPSSCELLIAHGRTSTGRVCPENVHPFRNQDLYLAHNGIVTWKGQGATPYSAAGCDSEQLLSWLASGGTWHNTHNDWSGFGTLLVLDALSGSLIAAKGDTTRLHIAKRAHGPGWIMATDDDDLLWICNRAGIALCTRPITVPQHLILFDRSGAIAQDGPWAGFATRSFTYDDHRSTGFNSAAGCNNASQSTRADMNKKQRKAATRAALLGLAVGNVGNPDPKDGHTGASATGGVASDYEPTPAEITEAYAAERELADANGAGSPSEPVVGPEVAGIPAWTPKINHRASETETQQQGGFFGTVRRVLGNGD